jgi:hypothetical protein
MAIYGVTDDRGRSWAFDPDMIYAIVRAAVRTRAVRRNSRVVSSSAGLFLPTTYHLETNWHAVTTAVNSEVGRYWAEAEMNLRTTPYVFYGTMVGLLTDAINDQNWFRTEMRSCQHRSSQNIDSAVTNWGTAVDAARLVRDGSATVLIVASGVGAPVAAAAGVTGVTVGTATGTLAVGSVLRGAFTYEDTGNVGSAAINAAGTFTVGMIGLGGAGATLTSAERATLFVISTTAAGTVSAGQALVEGNNVRQVAVAAVGGAMGQALGAQFGNLSFLAQVSVGTIVDLSASRLTGAAVSALGPSTLPAPATGGTVDFLGIPPSSAEAYIRRFAMSPA